MPVNVSYPGVYIQDDTWSVHAIVGVPTSVAAFVGFISRGPVNEPVQIFNFGDFEREFGGLDLASDLSYAVAHFLTNGGTNAWVVRIAPRAIAAAIDLKDAYDGGGNVVLTATATSAGAWGNQLRVSIDYAASDPSSLFNLTVAEVTEQHGKPLLLRSGVYRNLSMDASSPNFAVDVVNAASHLIRLECPAGVAAIANGAALRPAQSGTVWARQSPAINFATLVTPGTLDVDLLDPADKVLHHEIITLWAAAADRPTDLAQLYSLVQGGLNGAARPELAAARVLLVDDRIVVIPGGNDPALRFRFNAGPKAGAIDLTANAEMNVAAYRLGLGPKLQAQSGAVPGVDGSAASAGELLGSRGAKSGLFALEDVDLFNILCVPNQSDPALLAAAAAYAEERRAFALVDPPATVDTFDEAFAWIEGSGIQEHRNAAAYFPRVRFADPLQNNSVRSFASSGAIAGVYAVTDAVGGVWKAPAGIDAGVGGALGVDCSLTDEQNGALNVSGLNCVRVFPTYGAVVWGARTLIGADRFNSEWKYVNVRRLALFVEESIDRGIRWAAFEPNGEPLWAQIRDAVGVFMRNLFMQGAFQGSTASDAYFVNCDRTTTTQDDIDRGVFNVVVGFAPANPAEFVVITLQQLAGQVAPGA